MRQEREIRSAASARSPRSTSGAPTSPPGGSSRRCATCPTTRVRRTPRAAADCLLGPSRTRRRPSCASTRRAGTARQPPRSTFWATWAFSQAVIVQTATHTATTGHASSPRAPSPARPPARRSRRPTAPAGSAAASGRRARRATRPTPRGSQQRHGTDRGDVELPDRGQPPDRRRHRPGRHAHRRSHPDPARSVRSGVRHHDRPGERLVRPEGRGRVQAATVPAGTSVTSAVKEARLPPPLPLVAGRRASPAGWSRRGS